MLGVYFELKMKMKENYEFQRSAFKFENLFLELVEFYFEKDELKRPFCKIKKYQS
jgi:hypothetical protein